MRITRWVSPLLMLIGLCALVTGIACYFMQPGGPALVVPQTDLEIRDGVQGEIRDIAVEIHNRSGRPIRMVGAGFC